VRQLLLLGDSILDNAAYTAPEPDTADHLQRALGREWSVTLLARDGSRMGDLGFQLAHLPASADLAVLSIGGNDAIEHIGLLEERARSTGEVLDKLAGIADEFGHRYAQVLGAIAPRVSRLVVCTIYEPPLIDPATARLARVPLTLLNDRIIRAALHLGLDVLDLRTICTEATDFVKEIEPSARGARKIAGAIEQVARDGGALRRSRILGG